MPEALAAAAEAAAEGAAATKSMDAGKITVQANLIPEIV